MPHSSRLVVLESMLALSSQSILGFAILPDIVAVLELSQQPDISDTSIGATDAIDYFQLWTRLMTEMIRGSVIKRED